MDILTIDYTENYQLFYLKLSIKEILTECVNNNIYNLNIDHYNGCNFINDTKVPLIFPKALVNFIDKIHKNKIYKYNFIGSITQNRQWVNKYVSNNSFVKHSNRGRDNIVKYSFDKEYYTVISSSEFTLTPTGDCPWSYRFFEAIMCFSIPILENNSNDIYCKGYFYYYDDGEHIYYKDKAMENYNKFLETHILNSSLFSKWTDLPQ